MIYGNPERRCSTIVDPKNRFVQIEMEAACTDHLKMIGGYLPPHFKPVRFDEQTFQTEASVISCT